MHRLFNINFIYKMKRNLLLVIAIAFLGFANAQEKTASNGLKGAWWGMGQIQYQDDETNKLKQFDLMVATGTFVTPSITIGAGLGYINTKLDNNDATDVFVIMPLARKYWNISDKFYLFGQVDVPVTIQEDLTGYGVNLRPGIDFFVSSKFTLEATFGAFGYNAMKPKNGDAVGKTNLGFNMSEIKLGLKYIF